MKQQSYLLKDKDQWLVYTEWAGLLEPNSVDQWISSIQEVIELIPSDSLFRMVVNMNQLSPLRQEVHHYFRNALSVLLMNYGMYMIAGDFLQTGSDMQHTVRGIVCEGMAFQYGKGELMDAVSGSDQYFYHVLYQLNWQSQ